MKKIALRIILAGIVCLALVFTSIKLFSSHSMAASASNTLVVNANQVLRPVTHVATGSLYGLASASVPSDSRVEPIKPNTFVQMAVGGRQQGSGDVLVVAPEAARAGAKLVDRMSDYYAGWPYQFSWNNWLSVVDSQIASIKASAYYNTVASYELWNEPDNTWLSSNGTFESFWTTTYREVRAHDATKPIQGPSFSDNISDMQNFLQNAVATNTVPDIISWHELTRSSKIAGDVATVTGLEQKFGIAPRPIAIEEYAAPSEVGIPGPLVGYIAKFERLGINNAELAFWNQSGALGDLLIGQGGSPNAAYWLYTWYAAMSGNMVVTTPPAQTGIDGAAAVTSDNKSVSIIVGGCSGSCAVTVNGLNSLNLGATVSVKLEQTVSAGRTVAVSGPSTISTATYTPTNGTISVSITMNANDAYHITITPGSGSGATPTPTPTSTSTQTYDKIVNKNSGLVLGIQNASTSAGAQALQWYDTGAADHLWQIVDAGGGYVKIVNKNSGLVLGITNASTSAGAIALQWYDSGTADHLWQIVDAGGGYVKIMNKNSGLLLGIQNASTSAGALALQWSDNGTADHLWQIHP